MRFGEGLVGEAGEALDLMQPGEDRLEAAFGRAHQVAQAGGLREAGVGFGIKEGVALVEQQQQPPSPVLIEPGRDGIPNTTKRGGGASAGA